MLKKSCLNIAEGINRTKQLNRHKGGELGHAIT